MPVRPMAMCYCCTNKRRTSSVLILYRFLVICVGRAACAAIGDDVADIHLF